METTSDTEALLALAERVRQSVGDFVRATRALAETPRTARSETLGLLDQEGAMSTAALAERRNVKHQSMRLVIAQLEEDKLVEKIADTRDRRTQIVRLTAQGRTTLRADRRTRAEWIAHALRDQVTVEERRTLEAALAVLDKVAKFAPESQLSALANLNGSAHGLRHRT
jgi:DNA-binding MarR family transcriptional regulator